MNTLKLALLGFLLLEGASSWSVHAQYYPRNRYQPRMTPQMMRQMYLTNNANATATNAAAQVQAPAPPVAPTNAVAAVTNRPAVTYVRVVHPPVDPEKAKAAKADTVRRTVEFQKKRAEEGSESAQYELGVRYLKGDGVEKDEAMGRKWLTLSAKNGFTPAARKLEDLDKPAKPASDSAAGGVTEPASSPKIEATTAPKVEKISTPKPATDK